MTWTDCSRHCIGQCPCPNPPWLWKCNQLERLKKAKDPQKRWKSAMIKRWSVKDE